MNSIPLVFALGIICGGFLLHFLYPRPRCACRPAGEVVAASRDEEGWMLLDADGEVLPWPVDWPSAENLERFLFARQWIKMNTGTDEQPKEVWLKP